MGNWKYVGPHDGVDIRLPSGRSITVMRNESVKLLANEATAVSTLPGWEAINTKNEEQD